MRNGLAALLFSTVLAFPNLCSAQAPSNAACDKGQDISAADCHFFYLRKPLGQENTDPRIADRIRRAKPDTAIVRSYAVVIAVDHYPNFDKEKDLPAAKADLENLKKFLVEQSFDEIIVISNKDVTASTIDHFLGTYLNNRLDISSITSRVLIAFTGHGAGGDPEHGIPGSLVMNDATDSGDDAHLYDLKVLNAKLEKLANKSYQFVALIGACYSGGLFSATSYSGGNDMFPEGRGAHAITATKGNDLAYGIDDRSGSLFFDNFVKAAKDPWTDIDYEQLMIFPDGSRKVLGGGITRLGMVVGRVSAEVAKLGNIPGKGKPFPQPVYGSIKTNAPSEGAMFFLGPTSDRAVASVAAQTHIATAEVLRSTGSAIVGHPEIKVFSAPDTYSIYGVDVSHWEGTIDWKKMVESNKRLKFAYMKATERNKDPTFDVNWRDSKEVGLRHGAFHVFSFCRSATEQFNIIKANVPRESDALPFALDVLWYGKPMEYEKTCNDKVAIKKNLIELMSLSEQYFRKPIVLHTPAEFWLDFSSVVTPETIVWLQDWKDSPSKANGPNLPGAAPWTIWQFTRKARIAGINSPVDMNAFFGSASDFRNFAAGKGGAFIAARYPQK